jgi:hypothetical protein
VGVVSGEDDNDDELVIVKTNGFSILTSVVAVVVSGDIISFERIESKMFSMEPMFMLI